MAEGRGVIEHIEIEGFKSLEKVSLDLGALNIFVGTNASGKTNFLEALRVLQGIGYGFTADEIFNGKPKGANTEVWEGIRGGSNYAESFSRPGGNIVFRVTATVATGAAPVNYAVTFTFSPKDTRVYSERLNGQTINAVPFGNRPSLRSSAGDLAEHIANMQLFRPSPAVQREYSALSFATRMGEHGENFAALGQSILGNEATASAYVSWLRELTPAELDEVKILTGAMKDPLFAFRLRGTDYPAPMLSDGTLRFAAIAAAFFQPDPPKILLLEEIEEGLHPTRLQLLVELLKSQTGHGVEQVIATSHSPYAIAWLKEEDYKYVFLCTKNEETGATSITPFSEVPDLVELARTQSIADLFAEGWMENTL